MRLSIPPNSISPSSGEINQVVSHLRAELDTCSDQVQRALLHYDLALVYEQIRDDHSAAKELLAAVNANSTLREPLEHLIALIERRRSYVNLGKLLDRLGRIADSPEETIRAQLARGDFLVDHRSNLQAAAEAYEHVVRLQDKHRLAWLSLHYLGARQSDAKLVERALSARIQAAGHKAYRDGLRLQLARFQAMRGRKDLARATLEAASTPHSPMRFSALLHLEQLVVRPDDYAERAANLEQQAQVLNKALTDSAYATEHGVPLSRCAPELAADAWLRSALNWEASDRLSPRALDALQQADTVEPAHVTIVRAILRNLEHRQLHEARAQLSEDTRLNLGRPEAFRAALFVRHAQQQLRQGDADAALLSLGQALDDDPNSLTARALQLELLWNKGRYAELGKAYENTAQQLGQDSSRGRAYLMAGITWAFSSESSDAARAAFNLAAAAGSPQLTVARISKLLAAQRKDGFWLTEALSRQLESPTTTDRVSATLELARRAVLRGDDTEAQRRYKELTQTPDSRTLGWALLCYGPLHPKATIERLSALNELATASRGDTALALQQLVAAYYVKEGQPKVARDALLVLHEQHPERVPIAAQLVPLLRQLDDPEMAVTVLTQVARSNEHNALAEALHIQAGIIAWNAQARETAVRCFEEAKRSGSAGASEILHWALRSAHPDDPAARRKALDAALSAAGEEDRNLYALERFALEVGLTGQAQAASDALDAADEVSLDEVGEAVQLARALWPDAAHHDEAIQYLRGHSAAGKELVAATSYYQARGQLTPSAHALMSLAQAWADEGSLPAALEWFSLAVTSASPSDEASAREAIAKHLSAEAKASVLASAALLRHLAGHAERAVEGTEVAARLVNAELFGPTSSPVERSAALQAVRTEYDLTGSTDNQLTLLAMAAYNGMAAGQNELALELFGQAVALDSTDVSSWLGIADCARLLGRTRDEAIAQEHVGALHFDPKQAAHALRLAAFCYLDELNDAEAGYRCLERAVDLDIKDFAAFDRWFRYVRKLGDRERLVSLCTARLVVSEAPKELTRLYWERARAYRDLGRPGDALSDLENVRLLDAHHVGARALACEIFISLQNYGRAASELSQLAAMPKAPAEQRLMSAMAAVDLYETHVHDLDAALAVLHSVAGVAGDSLSLKERVARACARANRWHDAVRLLGELMHERHTAAQRAEAARLRIAIYRDELDAPEQALDTVERLLEDSPADAEALDLILDGVFDSDEAHRLLRAHLPVVLNANARELEPETAARLARIAEELDDLELRQLALCTLVTLGATSNIVLDELEMLEHRCAPYPRMTLDAATRELLIAERDAGPLLSIMRLLAAHLPEIIGPNLKSLGVGRRERKAAHELPDLRAEVAAWSAALGLDEVEIYVGGHDPHQVSAVPGAKPALVLGVAVRPPLLPAHRASLACRLLSLKHGTSLCQSRGPVEVAALLVAACRVGGAHPESPPFALIGEFERALSRELPRRVRKDLEPLAAAVVAQGQDPLEYAQAARESLDRIAAVAASDFSWVLLSGQQRQQSLRNLDAAEEQRQRRLLAFCLSPVYLSIREQLGLSAQ